jgi:hypothetical protein
MTFEWQLNLYDRNELSETLPAREVKVADVPRRQVHEILPTCKERLKQHSSITSDFIFWVELLACTPAAALCNKTASMVLAHPQHSQVLCTIAVFHVCCMYMSSYAICSIQGLQGPQELWHVRNGQGRMVPWA